MSIEVMEAHEGEHLSNILVYKFEHITKTGMMCMIKLSFSQARVCFMAQGWIETPQFVTAE